jgi:uncharacterized protein (DUF1778 family)
VTYVPLSLRLTLEEDLVIRQAADALDVKPSQLVEYASIEAAHRLGIFEDEAPPKKINAAWRVPLHREESATRRMTVSMNPPIVELLRRAAELMNVAAPAFAVGATLHHIARKKRADPDNRKLGRIDLPDGYG